MKRRRKRKPTSKPPDFKIETRPKVSRCNQTSVGPISSYWDPSTVNPGHTSSKFVVLILVSLMIVSSFGRPIEQQTLTQATNNHQDVRTSLNLSLGTNQQQQQQQPQQAVRFDIDHFQLPADQTDERRESSSSNSNQAQTDWLSVNGSRNSNHSQVEDELLALESARMLTIGRQPPYANMSLGSNISSNQFHLKEQPISNGSLAPIWLPNFSQNLKVWPVPSDQFLQLHVAQVLDLKGAQQQQQQQQQQQVPIIPEQLNITVAGGAGEFQDTKSASNFSSSRVEYETVEGRFPSLLAESQSEEEELRERLLADRLTNKAKQANASWHQLLHHHKPDVSNSEQINFNASGLMDSLMVTNRSTVSLVCDTDDMLLRLSFEEPFLGRVLASANSNRLTNGRGLELEETNCELLGNGSRFYEMRVPLNECNTRQQAPSLFINTIHIQFHPVPTNRLDNLDADDEVKTIICSYPIKPVAPPPLDLNREPAAKLTERQLLPPVVGPAKLTHYEPLVLISGLLFVAFSLVLVTAAAYYITRTHHRQSAASKSPLHSSNPGSFSSSQIYKVSPAQVSNKWMAPPLIGLGSNNDDRSQRKQHRRRLAKRRQLASKSRLKRPADLPAERARPMAPASIDRSSDSLADATSEGVFQIASTSLADYHPDTILVAPPKPPRASPRPIERIMHQSNIRAANDADDNQGDVSNSGLLTGSKRQKFDTNHVGKDWPASPGLQSNNGANKLERLVKAATSEGARPKSDQVRPPLRRAASEVVAWDTPPLQTVLPASGRQLLALDRPHLTSPEQYRRLERIKNLFVNSATSEDTKTTIKQQTSWDSRYGPQIKKELSSQETETLAKLLAEDETFRSLIIESVDRSLYERRLRFNPLYSARLQPKTWSLLGEILLDAELSSSEPESVIRDIDSSSSVSSLPKKPVVLADNETLEMERNVSGPSLSVQDRFDEAKFASASKEAKRSVVNNSSQDGIKIASTSRHLDVGHTLDREAQVEAQPSERQTLNSWDSLKSGHESTSESEKYEPELIGRIEERIKVTSGAANNNKWPPPLLHSTSLRDNGARRKSVVRVSRLGTRHSEERTGRGLTATLVSVNSQTSFRSGGQPGSGFTAFSRSSIEHRKFDQADSNSEPEIVAIDSMEFDNDSSLSHDETRRQIGEHSHDSSHSGKPPMRLR